MYCMTEVWHSFKWAQCKHFSLWSDGLSSWLCELPVSRCLPRSLKFCSNNKFCSLLGTSQIEIKLSEFKLKDTDIKTILMFLYLNVYTFFQRVRNAHLYETSSSSIYTLCQLLVIAPGLSIGQTLAWLGVSPIEDTFCRFSISPADSLIELVLWYHFHTSLYGRFNQTF